MSVRPFQQAPFIPAQPLEDTTPFQGRGDKLISIFVDTLGPVASTSPDRFDRVVGEHAMELERRDEFGGTLLHVLGEKSNRPISPITPEVLRHIIERVRHLLDAVDSNGETALHVSCRSRNIPFVEILLQCGAKVNMVSPFGFTALDLLTQNNTLTTQAEKNCLKQFVFQGGQCKMFADQTDLRIETATEEIRREQEAMMNVMDEQLIQSRKPLPDDLLALAVEFGYDPSRTVR